MVEILCSAVLTLKVDEFWREEAQINRGSWVKEEERLIVIPECFTILKNANMAMAVCIRLGGPWLLSTNKAP